MKNPPQSSAASSHRSIGAFVGECGWWLLLTLYFLLPPREAMTWGLDASNYGSYSWMFAAGRQFGGDSVAMIGPFGFLAYGHTYSGDLFFEYLIGDGLFKATFAFLVLQLFRQLRAGIWRWLWLFALVVFLPSVDDLLYDAAILVAGIALLVEREKSRFDFTTAIASVLLGFSVLMKGSHATLAGASLVLVIAASWFSANRNRALGIFAVAFATFVGGWLLAGQSLRHLPEYFHALFALTGGYNATMGLDAEARWLSAGLIMAGLIFGVLAIHAWGATEPGNRSRKISLLFFACFFFLQWKHGFVRADGHVFMFFGFVAVAAPLLQMIFWRADAPAREHRKIWATVALSSCAFLVAAAATSSFSLVRLGQLLREVPRKFERNTRAVFSPRSARQPLDQALRQQKQRADLADVRREIGSSTIDFFGYEQGIILLNAFNYHPRPMSGGTFNVYHPHLQELNGRFMHDASRRPDFFLVKLQTIDHRLPTADDPLTLQGLLAFYQPVRAQRDYVLFEKKAPNAPAPAPRPIGSRAVALGEWADVPAVPADELLLFSLEARPSFSGALRGFVYHPPLTDLTVTVGSELAPETFRLAPLSAEVPVLLSPLLTSTVDVVALYGENKSAKIVRRIRVGAPQGGFKSAVTINFFTLPKPAAASDNAATEITTYLEHPHSNRPVLSLVTQQTGITELFGEPITLVHAPGSIVFPVEMGDQQFHFSFGLMPQAYDPGETDGVEFIVEYLQSDRPPQVLFSRLLQPRTVEKDRGLQSARVFFPPQIVAGSVRIRTERGPSGNGAWDQSYVTHVQLETGAFDPRQLTGFTLPPEPPGFPDPAPAALDGREIRLLAPPGEVRFPVPPAAQTATIGLGVLPAAYEGENHSDGIGCEIVLFTPEGNERVLLSRTLDPVRDRGARGTVTFEVSLANSPPGSRLALRINGGPKQDLRWDWSYVQTVRFR